MRVAVYPGSFDPITCGHMDIIRRSSKIFDKLVVAVLNNPSKNSMFDFAERKKMIEEAISDLDNVEVDAFNGLLIDYVSQKKYDVIVKGLRAISDFESELQMASMNRKLNSKIETLFMMTATEYSFLSSSLVKEVFGFGGNIESLVPKNVIGNMIEKFTEV
ncbi:pantetheine-phosphate adenylyltransferase [Helicovermis profundi]|uniref:Phosphopantetheine adenylyltransferase n=1 Tax=Helicovermis profundi TaxID=3065157 RepID=A0AAU9ESM4_9FIRM|nr:pantetheine-phosphate adenylyltransferase [Clostridia bacterium S502]